MVESNKSGLPVFPRYEEGKGYTWIIPEEVLVDMPTQFADWRLEMARRGWLVKVADEYRPPYGLCHVAFLFPLT